jgi:hypothetical protein
MMRIDFKRYNMNRESRTVNREQDSIYRISILELRNRIVDLIFQQQAARRAFAAEQL